MSAAAARAVLAILGAASLAAAPAAMAGPAGVVVRLCGGGMMHLPLPSNNDDDRRHCPGGCHAACSRGAKGDGEEDLSE